MKKRTSQHNLMLLFTVIVSAGTPPNSLLYGQVFDEGPSDSALFDTVFNIPPDPDIGPFEEIDSSTQVNLDDGGEIGFAFEAGLPNGSSENVEVNVFGGVVATRFTANAGSEVNILGGTVGSLFDAMPGSFVNISGGLFGEGFEALPGSDVELIGGEFQLNGEAFNESTVTIGPGDVFAGTLADGSVFVFNDLESDVLSAVTLTTTNLPAADPTPLVIDMPSSLPSLRPGQTLTLEIGGELGSEFSVLGADLNVNGGIVGPDAEAVGSNVTITDGRIGGVGEFDVFASNLNVQGGTVENVRASAGSEVNIDGGLVDGVLFRAEADSVVNINGGQVGEFILQMSMILDSSVANITDGEVLASIALTNQSELNVSGGRVLGVTTANSGQVNVSGGQTGAVVVRPDAIANVTGGMAGILEVNGQANITDGFVSRVDSFGGDINISGGQTNGVRAFAGGLVVIEGGTFGEDGLDAVSGRSGSRIDIHGGTFFAEVEARSDSELNVTGGVFLSDFSAESNSEVNLFGSEFLLDGKLLVLELDETVSILDRDVNLAGILADGSNFEFDLNSSSGLGDFFSIGASLTITQVQAIPEPGSTLLCIGWLFHLTLLQRRNKYNRNNASVC